MGNTSYGARRRQAMRSNTVLALNISCEARLGAVLASVALLVMSALRRPRGRVLVVDDDPVICELIATTLAEHGFSVRQASDGREMLYLIGRELADVVILDVHLPDISGYALCRRLREDYGDGVGIMLIS